MLGRRLSLTLAALAGVAACGNEPQARVSSIELEPCASVTAEALCGTLRVHEDREDPQSPAIDLKIVVLPSTSRQPAPDPVFLLAGGPGQGAAAVANFVAGYLEPIRAERDLVFVDLRGTGESHPLACDFEHADDLHELLSAGFVPERLDACLEQYRRDYDSVDLQRYVTDERIDDLDLVRAALGYDQVNLLGISYGTREALVYMRRHPQQVRAAVLDGVAPPDVSVSLAAPAHGEEALRAVLADCRAQPACDAAFPGLERKLAAVLQELETGRKLHEVVHPRTGAIERIDISPAGFMGALRIALYSEEPASLIPLIIDRAHAGDFAPAAAMLLRMSKLSKTLSMGLYMSVACAEDLAENDVAHRRQAVAGLEFFDDLFLVQLEQGCARWPHARLDPAFFEPVSSDVPTLLLSGRYDPVTPPSLAEHAAESLSNARLLTVGVAHHGIWSEGCTPKLLASFFADADPRAVDPGCQQELTRAPFFLSAAGPRPPAELGPSRAITGLARGNDEDPEEDEEHPEGTP
ncbi:MAG: alpha/beta fold hydrolase [Myxococcales bacterium]|nr:alpha/beta fold hydrolase [Myxococcales bacterium]